MLRKTTRVAGSGDHPFLSPSDSTVLEPLDAAGEDALIGTGPSLPLGTSPQLPSPFQFGGTPLLSHLHVVGLHGGAGTTTVSRILGERLAVDADRSIPSAPAAVLPNGNILFAASPGHWPASNSFLQPVHYFELECAFSGPACSTRESARCIV